MPATGRNDAALGERPGRLVLSDPSDRGSQILRNRPEVSRTKLRSETDEVVRASGGRISEVESEANMTCEEFRDVMKIKGPFEATVNELRLAVHHVCVEGCQECGCRMDKAKSRRARRVMRNLAGAFRDKRFVAAFTG